MTEHRYTVAEIEALRQLMENKFLYGSYVFPTDGRSSRGFHEDEKVKVVEEWVRTAMLAGHTAKDYQAAEILSIMRKAK